jgi:3-phosphoshikimate 1-carboxyvinyltransferase
LASDTLLDLTEPSLLPKDCALLTAALSDLKSGESELHVGDAGTAMRFITALACTQEKEVVISGSARMHQRPIGILVDALISLGADIEYLEEEGYPPLKIKASKLTGGKVSLAGNVSSQFISAILMIGGFLENGVSIEITGERVSSSYINLTLEVMKQFGINTTQSPNRISVSKREEVTPTKAIEKDWSAAAFWYGMIANSTSGELVLEGLELDSKQGDRVCPALFLELGVSSYQTEEGVRIKKSAKPTPYFNADCTEFPDLAQALAFTCAGLGIGCRLTGLSTLPLKETDRLAAIKTELKKVGIEVQINTDSLQFAAVEKKEPTTFFEGYDDHRMVMSASILCLSHDKLSISGHDAVAKSYPTFFDELASLGFSIKT